MNYRTTAIILGLGVLLSGGPIGCGSKPETKAETKLECGFILPQSRKNLQDYVEYTGRTAAVASVDVKARVSGFLKDTQWFKEGDPVRKGQKLFLIDPEPYDAQLEQAMAQVSQVKAQVSQAEASLKQAEAQIALYEAQVALNTATFEQAKEVEKKNKNAFSELQLRIYEAQMKIAKAGLAGAAAGLVGATAARDAAKAALAAAEASRKIFEKNKSYTTVTSLIDGVVGRRNQTPGNVIIQDQTLLTTVVSVDRMYVYFDMDAPTWNKFNKRKEEKPARPASAADTIFLELPGDPTSPAGEQASQVQGNIDFFNNQFNPATDTILVRGVFANPKKKDGGQQLRPGMFVRVKLSIGQPYQALLVPDRAIISKMGRKYVYVVDAANRVKEIPVDIGQLQEKGLRVIKGGQLAAKDRVIQTRLLEIQPKQEIVPVPLQSAGG